MDDLIKQIMGQVDHQVDHAMTSPQVINRNVGEAMRHIGSVLTVQSSAYLPIRDDELLVAPERFSPDSDDALILIKRVVNTGNAFMLMAERKPVEEGHKFELIGYKPDEFNLNKTQFIDISPIVGNELIRQLNLITQGDGHVLVCCVVIKDHFKNKPLVTDDLLTGTPEPAQTVDHSVAPVEKDEPKKAVSLLPIVDNSLLL